MTNFFPYASAITLSQLFVASLSPAFILNLMQFVVHPSLEMMPCLMAFFFSEAVSTDHSSTRVCQNHLRSLLHSLQTLLPVSL